MFSVMIPFPSPLLMMTPSSDQPPSKKSRPNIHTKNDPPIHTSPFPPSLAFPAQQLLTSARHLLGGRSPDSILSSLSSLEGIRESLHHIGTAVEAIAQAVNALPTPFASSLPPLCVAQSVAELCHPLMLQTFTPAATTADGNCMYHALSRLVCGNKRLSVVFRILTAYATAKYRD